MDSITPGTKKKFTLASPEGIGLVVLALGLGATAFMFAGQILPFILTTLVLAFESVWVGLGLVASVLFIGWLFKSKQLHLILWNVYKLAMRGFAGFFIEMNPIGIIKNRLEKMRERKGDLEGSREDLKGQRVKLNREIEKTKAEIEQKFREAKAAHIRVADIASKAAAETDQVRKMQITLDAQQMDNEYKLALTEAGGKKETVEQKWLPLLNKMDQMDIILGKASIAADFIIRKTEIDIKKAETEWNVIRTANSAMKSAMSAMSDNPDERALFEQTMEYMENDMSNKLGQMERMMEFTSHIVSTVDLQNDVALTKGMESLDQFMQDDSLSFISAADHSTIGQQANLGTLTMNPATTKAMAHKSEW